MNSSHRANGTLKKVVLDRKLFYFFHVRHGIRQRPPDLVVVKGQRRELRQVTHPNIQPPTYTETKRRGKDAFFEVVAFKNV
jgi:hypothetical protein